MSHGPEHQHPDTQQPGGPHRDPAPQQHAPGARGAPHEPSVSSPAGAAGAASGGGSDEASPAGVREQVMAALATVYDPEVPVDIVNFGLIYGLDITDELDVRLTMSLTSPSCPSAQAIPAECEQKIRAIDGVNDVTVNIVWDPPWGPEMISPEGRAKLGMD